MSATGRGRVKTQIQKSHVGIQYHLTGYGQSKWSFGSAPAVHRVIYKVLSQYQRGLNSFHTASAATCYTSYPEWRGRF